MRVGPLSSCLVSVYFLLGCSALPHAKDYHKLGAGSGAMGSEYVPASADGRDNGLGREPSCEELRAMWRFSKRQSRATEITNEIPTYRDPFAYNMWTPYARSRSIVGGRRKTHVYGRPVFEVPRSRSRDEMARLFGTVPQGAAAPPRKVQTAFRLSGGGVPMGQLPHLTPQSGSFQHLQKLIRAERARELQQQRMAEEEAARNAALKEVSSQTYFGRMVQDPPAHLSSASGYMYGGEPSGLEKNTGHGKGRAVLQFPDLLAPASRYADDEYLTPQYADGHMFSHRSMPQPISRAAPEMERGFVHH